ncbi:MAG: hypothetical protein M3Y27_06465 [Acidobacteriota bacterium]|nr:hypothetical protein [Acidobacteriota bacterium]
MLGEGKFRRPTLSPKFLADGVERQCQAVPLAASEVEDVLGAVLFCFADEVEHVALADRSRLNRVSEVSTDEIRLFFRCYLYTVHAPSPTEQRLHLISGHECFD